MNNDNTKSHEMKYKYMQYIQPIFGLFREIFFNPVSNTVTIVCLFLIWQNEKCQ